MNYKIIATLGPGSNTPAIWREMITAGATGFRLNTSHISMAQLEDWLIKLDHFLSTIKPAPELVLDLQGSKWRLGRFESHELIKGQTVTLRHLSSSHKADILPVPHEDFFQAAPSSSQEILLNDAKILLSAEKAGLEEIKARVINGGEISAYKGLTFSESDFRKESLSVKDSQILEKTPQLAGLRYAISYVKDAAEMSRYRSIIGEKTYLIAKLERKTAIEEALEIAKLTDELWLCRGDLGAEMGSKRMAEVANEFSKKIETLDVPVLLAGQVLEHMVDKPAATRSEVCYIFDSLDKGYSGFILSDETAIGNFPIETCRTASLFQS